MEDDIVALLALDADSRGLFPAGAIDQTRWTSIANEPDALHQDHWLLAYEANLKHWIQTPAVVAHPEFYAMHNAGVSFYDPSQNVPHFPAAAGRMPGGSLTNYYA